MQFDVSSADPNDFALYFLDWDRRGRVQDLAIIDKQSGVTLLQKRIENFDSGIYARFRLQGAVSIRCTRVAGPNVVMTGLFAGGAIQGPSGTPSLSTAQGPSALIIRVAAQTGTTIQIQVSTDFASWNRVSEHQVTAPVTEVPIPTRFNRQFFRAMIVD